jgi:hypothetical protein
MDILKNGMQNLKSIGFGAAVPGLRDQIFNAVNNVTSSDSDQKAKIQSVINEDRAEQKKLMEQEDRSQNRLQSRPMRKQQTVDNNEGGFKGYKKGGKVSSASKRADGIAIKGKTKGRII